MFRYRHELDVGESHVHDIGNEFVRELTVREPAISLVLSATPGSKMNFVNTQRLAEVGPGTALLHPLAVGPHVSGIVNSRRVARRRLVVMRERIGFQR